jgi:alginate O-acetyltransferase complex protein AlgI
MVFNSLHFFIFFPIVTLGFFLLPQRLRWAWLLLASCYFYMAFIPVFILILLFTILVDYFVGRKLGSMPHGPARKWVLLVSLAANVGVLAIFKYFYFIDANLAAIAEVVGWNYSLSSLSIILPIGLSFHTFQSMSYIIEVYRGNQPAERHLGIFGLYVMYYPQLVAGPIERPQNLLHQLRAYHAFDATRVTSGLKLMLWGLFKKVAIADPLAVTVDAVYADPSAFSGPALAVATIAFAVQIYCDFSGYSDIAIGASRVMGIELMRNFRQPYFSQSISEFWRRWHISLSTWFRDYLYIPLGGNRVSPLRQQMNLLIVFLVSGLWHGANWTFVIWGALHGLYLMASMQTAGLRERAVQITGLVRFPLTLRVMRTLFVFVLVCFAWIFFRAENLSDALYIARHVLDAPADAALASLGGLNAFLSGLGISKFTLLAIGVLFVADLLQQGEKQIQWWQRASRITPLRWSAYYALGFWILLRFNTEAKQFIYFQF